jgi:rhodanese-related sulfurtransferase
MSRFNAKLGAALLVGLAGLYLVLSVTLGRSARADVPVDLTARAADAGLDVWKAAAFVVESDGAAIVDVRPADAYARYHLPLATNLPEATPEELKATAARHPAMLVYAGTDALAQRLVAQTRALAPGARIHYLVDGARAWYLAFALPVPLFAEASPPAGYAEALATTTAWFASPGPAERRAVTEALQKLAKADYQPSLLRSGKKAAAGGAKKKIGGGCG